MNKERQPHPFVSLRFERTIWKRGVELIAGVDEAGRGPLAGPVVAAAVIFPRDVLIEGVDDSKKLPEQKREELYEQIREKAVSIGVGIASHVIIDRINILQASHVAMREAIERLTVQPHIVLVDGQSFSHETIRYRNIIDGDAKSFTIAAASIIAKVTRDRLMREFHERYPEYGFNQHKGYATKQHLDAIRRYGLCDIHRKSFRQQLQLFEDVG